MLSRLQSPTLPLYYEGKVKKTIFPPARLRVRIKDNLLAFYVIQSVTSYTAVLSRKLNEIQDVIIVTLLFIFYTDC